MAYTKRLYLMLHPTVALIGSQYEPAGLARHYTAGPTRHYMGKVVFAEVDIGFRHPFFDIDSAVRELRPHEDGRPKATKFIASYRVLEHIDFDTLAGLYLTSPEGECLELSSGPFQEARREGELSVYAEIAPLRMLVLSRLGFAEFGEFLTRPGNPIGAPTFLYTQLDLDLQDYLRQLEANPLLRSPIPNLHTSILRDAVQELSSVTYKSTKGLSLHNSLDTVSYKLIRGGFMFASAGGTRFYPMPSLREIERASFRFWRSM